MGCLNSGQGFDHWFGNIHLSGPCNRECYFCIGQHMMDLDRLNNLNKWPLDGIDRFVDECDARGVMEVNLTGTNTDPLLFAHKEELVEFVRSKIPGVSLGIRTNGAMASELKKSMRLFDKASVSIPTVLNDEYRKVMGCGYVPDILDIVKDSEYFGVDLKINSVLCKETEASMWFTLTAFAACGVKRVNLREPYGQPHIGDVVEMDIGRYSGIERVDPVMGMPAYKWRGMTIVYWDVHFVHVESVNLYANGRVSTDYPITRGHSEHGQVLGQENFKTSGRIRNQWVKEPVNTKDKQ